MDLQYDVLKEEILGHSRKDGWTEERWRGNTGKKRAGLKNEGEENESKDREVGRGE